MKHLLPELPYAQDALAPAMSADTLNYHYGKHLQTYLDNVNRMIEGTPFADMKLKDMITKAQGALYNNAAQAFNHIIFFKQLTPTPTTISPLLTQALVARFGSVDAFKSEFSNAAAALFGSGWVWLALDANNVLQIVPEPNAGNPITRNMRPLMCIDVWEHAYYLDYQNTKAYRLFWGTNLYQEANAPAQSQHTSKSATNDESKTNGAYTYPQHNTLNHRFQSNLS